MTDIPHLVGRLDVDQKIAQIQGVVPMDLVDFSVFAERRDPPVDLSQGFPWDVERLPLVRPHGVGHLSLGSQLHQDLGELRRLLARFQELARDLTPFGLGVLVHAEAINGLTHAQGHQFPTAWGQAASWDPDLTRCVGDIAARQAREVGIHMFFSPLLDLARDPRWGRVHETYGEDPELVARMGIGFIDGVQGDRDDTGVVATGKHFLGYGTSLGALNQAATNIGRRELTDVHAAPFRRAIAEARLSVVMNSYNEIDGIPAAANHWLLTELLRDELGFDGLVVSDYDAISMLHRTYQTAAGPGEAAAQALEAGLDVELPSDAMTSHLRPLLDDGRLPEEVLDRAVVRVLALKARLGLVPEVRTARGRSESTHVGSDEAAARARALGPQTVTMLANDGTLPLRAGAVRVVVVGPAADELRIHFGAYTSVADTEVPQAIARIATGEVPGLDPNPDVFPDLFQTMLPGIEPVFEEGARRLHPDATTVVEALQRIDPTVAHWPLGSLDLDAPALDEVAVADAVAGAEVVVAVVGERTGWVGNHTAGEGRTVANPTLPGNQIALVEAAAASGRPVVTVVVSGRPLLLERVHHASAAVVLAPLLGPCAGRTIADVVFGIAEPGGRTPSTFPRHVGQIPIHHGHPIGSGYDHPTLRRHGYVDLPDSTPLYPFGHGLTYTTFEVTLDEVRVEGEILHVDCSVENDGGRAGSTVVQLYARHHGATVVRPVRQLVDFARIALDAGARTTHAFAIPIERLAYTWPDGRRGVEAGTVTLLLGLSSADIRETQMVDIPEFGLRRRSQR
jgi:beta-glucosidase